MHNSFVFGHVKYGRVCLTQVQLVHPCSFDDDRGRHGPRGSKSIRISCVLCDVDVLVLAYYLCLNFLH
jgi:hypothetical protein